MSSHSRWVRPENLKYPNVFSKFVTTDNFNASKLVQYRIEDIPENRYHEACEFMLKNFVPYEPKMVARNGMNDPLLLEDYYDKYMYGLKQKVSVACFKRDSDEFVAVNILEVLGRNDPTSDIKTKSKTCVDNDEVVNYVLEQADLFNRHNVDYYLSGTGLAIDPQYRRRGIATEMIKARLIMLDFYNLELTSTGYSSIGAQKAAEKAGCKVDYSISYEELAKIRPNWNFLGTDTESYVQMSFKRYDV
ncbi:hypothetical protein PVAND_013680 [Polypedilum vanderplanki]|uniref:N-acetyltransferase domain-containing protein n=1 Tax=Polypedilum vanderplanki TaxID=319348 RepID=A0A9J6CS42_POLVA|nr:hypothetical protein PVAND_013680 [Polypedilum vanderplanki]